MPCKVIHTTLFRRAVHSVDPLCIQRAVGAGATKTGGLRDDVVVRVAQHPPLCGRVSKTVGAHLALHTCVQNEKTNVLIKLYII